MQQKVSLHLGSADLRVDGQRSLSKLLSLRRRLLWVEPAEHLCELPLRAMADVLLQVNAAGSDQRWVQPVCTECRQEWQSMSQKIPAKIPNSV